MVSKAETEPDAGDKEFPVSYALPGLSAYLTKNTEQAKRPESTDFVPLFHSLPDACHAAFYFTKGQGWLQYGDDPFPVEFAFQCFQRGCAAEKTCFFDCDT